MANDTIDLEKHWCDLQGKMKLSIAEARKQNHKGSGGDAAESGWAELLGDYLPRRFDVLKDATVIDSDGRCSEQIDLAIYDSWFTPRLWKHGDKCWIPAESVYCIIECKAEINKGNVEAAGKKMVSVRRLNRTKAGHHDNSLGMHRDPIEPKRIIGILLADRYGWKDDSRGRLVEALGGLGPNGHLDYVLSLDNGRAYRAAWSEEGLGEVETVTGDNSLIAFLMRLCEDLNFIGTVAPCDYPAYVPNANWRQM